MIGQVSADELAKQLALLDHSYPIVGHSKFISWEENVK
jgi:hypothetical protein